MDDATAERVRALVRAIPPGQVRSYGEIADEAGLSSARLVGRLLAEDGHDLPWHRVVRADGSFAQGEKQRRRLRKEGIPFAGKRVDMEAAHLPREALNDLR